MLNNRFGYVAITAESRTLECHASERNLLGIRKYNETLDSGTQQFFLICKTSDSPFYSFRSAGAGLSTELARYYNITMVCLLNCYHVTCNKAIELPIRNAVYTIISIKHYPLLNVSIITR